MIEKVDSLISGAGIAYGRNGYPEWNDHVTDLRQLAMLRERLRHWFYERGYRDNARLAAHLGTLMLDPRTTLAGAPLALSDTRPS